MCAGAMGVSSSRPAEWTTRAFSIPICANRPSLSEPYHCAERGRVRDRHARSPRLLQGITHELGNAGGVDAHQTVLGARRVEHGPEDVECGPDLQRAADLLRAPRRGKGLLTSTLLGQGALHAPPRGRSHVARPSNSRAAARSLTRTAFIAGW